MLREELRQAYPDAVILMDHSRFLAPDRLEHEQEILRRVGKNTDAQMRRGVLVIGTQVLEQSLDLDFDLLITDLCPMDLLLQRIGIPVSDRRGWKCRAAWSWGRLESWTPGARLCTANTSCCVRGGCCRSTFICRRTFLRWYSGLMTRSTSRRSRMRRPALHMRPINMRKSAKSARRRTICWHSVTTMIHSLV